MVILEVSQKDVDRLESLIRGYPHDFEKEGLKPDDTLASWKVNVLDKAIAELKVFTTNEGYIWVQMIWYKDNKEFARSDLDEIIGGSWECFKDPELSVFVNVV